MAFVIYIIIIIIHLKLLNRKRDEVKVTCMSSFYSVFQPGITSFSGKFIGGILILEIPCSM